MKRETSATKDTTITPKTFIMNDYGLLNQILYRISNFNFTTKVQFLIMVVISFAGDDKWEV